MSKFLYVSIIFFALGIIFFVWEQFFLGSMVFPLSLIGVFLFFLGGIFYIVNGIINKYDEKSENKDNQL